jgi:hypothetical protein
MMKATGHTISILVLLAPKVKCCHGAEIDLDAAALLHVNAIYAILPVHRIQQQSVFASVMCYRPWAVARRAASAMRSVT